MPDTKTLYYDTVLNYQPFEEVLKFEKVLFFVVTV